MGVGHINFTKDTFRSEVCDYEASRHTFIWHCLMAFGDVFFIQQAIRFGYSNSFFFSVLSQVYQNRGEVPRNIIYIFSLKAKGNTKYSPESFNSVVLLFHSSKLNQAILFSSINTGQIIIILL